MAPAADSGEPAPEEMQESRLRVDRRVQQDEHRKPEDNLEPTGREGLIDLGSRPAHLMAVPERRAAEKVLRKQQVPPRTRQPCEVLDGLQKSGVLDDVKENVECRDDVVL